MPLLVRILVILGGIKLTIPLAFMAVMMVAFMGSVHGLPGWAFIYIGMTQVIPLIVAFTAWLVLLFTCFVSSNRYFWIRLLVGSFIIYAISLGILVLIFD